MTAESTLKLAAVVERYERVPTVEFWDNHKRPFEQVPVCPQLNELYFTNAFVFKERFCSIFCYIYPVCKKKILNLKVIKYLKTSTFQIRTKQSKVWISLTCISLVVLRMTKTPSDTLSVQRAHGNMFDICTVVFNVA